MRQQLNLADAAQLVHLKDNLLRPVAEPRGLPAAHQRAVHFQLGHFMAVGFAGTKHNAER